MVEPSITCPKCHNEIKLTETLAAPLIDKIRKESDAKLRLKEEDFAKRETLLREQQNAVAKARVDVEVLVRVDQHFIDLRCKALQHPFDHRFAAQHAQTLVDTAHAPALAAGQNHAGDFGRFEFRV